MLIASGLTHAYYMFLRGAQVERRVGGPFEFTYRLAESETRSYNLEVIRSLVHDEMK
jgi:hypothetical protein